MGNSLTQIDGWAFVSDMGYWSNTHYVNYPLNFKKIYCKTSNPPTIKETPHGLHEDYSDSLEVSFDNLTETSYRVPSTTGTFRGSTSSINILPHLVVPTGAMSEYKNSDWGKIFTLIEEVEF